MSPRTFCLGILPDISKFWTSLKSKAFSVDKTDEAQMIHFVCKRVENSVGKRENTGYQHFLLFPHVQKPTILLQNQSQRLSHSTKGTVALT